MDQGIFLRYEKLKLDQFNVYQTSKSTPNHQGILKPVEFVYQGQWLFFMKGKRDRFGVTLT